MAEKSLFWTDATGDGGPYNQTQLAEWLEYLFTTDQAASEGVLKGADNELAVSGASSPVAVATGAALVKGHWYRNTAAVNVAVASPAAATRIDRVVLQADWTAQEVRIALVAGVEGGAAPALTQTDGTKWEISLAQVSITTGGAITLTDERVFCHFGTKVNTAMLDTGVLSADATGRAAMATDYFDAATVLLKIADNAFAADVPTRRLFVDGIWQAAQLANNCLSADATGRAKVQNGYFDAATVLAKFAAACFGADAGTRALFANSIWQAAQLDTDAVETAKIKALAVTAAKLAADAVETAKIKDDNVTVGKLAHSIDAQPIGFNADTVDGYHATDIIASGLFVGMIMPFYGTLGGSDGHRPVVSGAAKEEWHLCNGDLVGAIQTPDMQGRMAVGAGGTLAEDLGDVGGAATINLAHSHSDGTLAAANHQHGVSPTYTSTMQVGTPTISPPESGGSYSVPSNSHFHNLEFNSTSNATADVTGNTGSSLSSTQSVMNPYVALYWIMKVA